MKIVGYEVTTLKIPEDDPLANMPEEVGRMRPVVILRLRVDDGMEGIGDTFYGERCVWAIQNECFHRIMLPGDKFCS